MSKVGYFAYLHGKSLTPYEERVLKMMAVECLSDKDISIRCRICMGTVKILTQRIRAKLGGVSRYELIRDYWRGLLEPAGGQGTSAQGGGK